jgi:rhodanese-related sulfurtransferase
MPVKRIPPREAHALLAQGWSYVDVRSVPEFETGHPAGAFNVPLMHFTPGRGMAPNPEFVAVMQKRFPKESKLIVGCKSGSRSQRAAELLASLGYTDVIDLEGGLDGGWKPAGLPLEAKAAADKSWDGLK